MRKLITLLMIGLVSAGAWGQTNKIESTGNIGVGTLNPEAALHVESAEINESSISRVGANLIIEGTGNSRTTDKGASLGFVVPANTDGSNPWQQGRILVTPGNTANENASGRMYLQTRYLNGSNWDWRNNLVLMPTGNIGVGTLNPEAALHVESAEINESSISRVGANLIIEGTGNSRTTDKGASLGFVVPANTDGSNPWQQGRILVTPGNTANENASGRMYLQTRYLNGSNWDWKNNLVLMPTGNIGVGTDSPAHKLDVAGTIRAEEILVEDIAATNMNLSGDVAANNITIKANGNTADLVFEEYYNLKNLSEVETFIKTNKHLPNIPSATEMEEHGVNLAEMNKLLLQKIEELTLYAIEKDKEVQSQKLKVEKLEEDRKMEQGEREKLEKQLKDQHEDVETMAERLAKIETLLMKDAYNE